MLFGRWARKSEADSSLDPNALERILGDGLGVAQHVAAEEVSFSLRFHTVQATKNAGKASAEDDAQIPSWDVAQIPGEDTPY